MPFEDAFDDVYERGIKPGFQPGWLPVDSELYCIRADELFQPGDIMCQVCQNIQGARFVVADMTDRNPNVFYELGLAHAFAKTVILVTQDLEDVPFDLRPMRIIEYGTGTDGLGKLAVDLRKGILALLPEAKPVGPLPPQKVLNSFVSTKSGEDMILIPAGEFVMGSNSGREDEKPERKVYLPDFHVSRYPVTNAEFEAFVKASDHVTAAEKGGTGTDWRHPRGLGSSIAGKDRHPVVQVSWSDAVGYCRWAGKRLPTEAEWEKAARGTDGRTWPWGDEWADGKCNTKEAGVGDTTPVGHYSPASDSPYGLVDMIGNVWEWTADWYKAYPGGTFRSDEFGERLRVRRGGAWLYDRGCARCAYRSGLDPDSHGEDLGFRVAE
jgi:formylglycine-generating enzyme required for sulfatase activity